MDRSLEQSELKKLNKSCNFQRHRLNNLSHKKFSRME